MADAFLTTEQLAGKYHVDGMNNKSAWYKLLTRWRDKRSLVEGADYTIDRQPGRPPQFLYSEPAVLRLLKTCDSMFATSVRIEYRARISRIRQSSEIKQTPEAQPS